MKALKLGVTIGILLAFASLTSRTAGALEDEGAAAAQAFEAGQPAEAARRYEVLLQTRGPSADLFFNLGAAYGFAEDPGRAIWALERARRLAPRDPDILHNLEVMRQRVRVARLKQRGRGKLTDGEPDGLSSMRLFTTFTEVELALPMLFFNVFFFVLLAARRLSDPGGRRDAITVLAGTLGLCGVLCLAALVARQSVVASVAMGVVVSGEGKLSDAPTASSSPRRHADLYRGAAVRVLDKRSDGWVRIGLVGGSLGWVREDEIGLVQ